MEADNYAAATSPGSSLLVLCGEGLGGHPAVKDDFTCDEGAGRQPRRAGGAPRARLHWRHHPVEAAQVRRDGKDHGPHELQGARRGRHQRPHGRAPQPTRVPGKGRRGPMTGQEADSGGVRGADALQVHQLERPGHCEAQRRALCSDAARAARLRRRHPPGGQLLRQDYEAGGRRGRPLPGHTA
eukprot:4241135-Pyramimonas_sp.AAC.1